MSVHHISWAMDQKTGSASRKAVLVALANYAHRDTGKCCPHIETIATTTELSVATVKRALVDLVDGGLVTRSRTRRPDGTLGGYHYVLPIVRVVADPGVTMTPDPGLTMTPQEPGRSLEPKTPLVVPPHNGVVPVAKQTLLVDRKKATDNEVALAAAILAQWNTRAGQALMAQTWVSKIIMRIREHPNATLADHAEVIQFALDHPWWDRPADPGVVYGSDAQFERSVLALRRRGQVVRGTSADPAARRYGRGMTTRQILDMTQGGTQ